MLETTGNSLLALGDERGAAILGRAAFYRENRALIDESVNLPLPELAAAMRERGENGMEAAARHRIYADRVRALTLDPAGAVNARALRLVARMAAAPQGSEPETALSGEARASARQDGGPSAILATARLRLQAGDGLAAPLQRILSAEEKDDLSMRWRSGDGQERLQLFQKLQAGYGKHAGRVMGEMGLNPLEQSLANTALAKGTSSAARAFLDLSEAASVPDKELPKLDTGDETLRRDLVSGSERLAAMRDMLGVMPGNTAFAGAIRAAEDAAVRLSRMRGGNTQAVIDMLDAGIGRIKDNTHVLTFEEGIVERDLLQDALRAKASFKLEEFEEVLPGYAAGQKTTERVRYLTGKGIWMNAPDMDGYVLYDPQSQAPIINKNGEYFRVREQDVPALAEELAGQEY